MFILIHNGYINSTLDYIVIRGFAMEYEKERLSDTRYQRNGFMASVKSPNGRTIPLRNTKHLFYLHGNKLETYPINLKERELFILHGESHESIDDLINKLTQNAPKYSKDSLADQLN